MESGATKVDREYKKQILAARDLIESAIKADCNEAETRRRIERIFESLLDYDPFKNITREHAVRGAGEAEYCDFAVSIDEGTPKKPFMMIEIKRVNVELALKHLNQVATYAINAGCEWLLLTNGKDWRLYHVTFGQPPETTLVESWHLLTDEIKALAEKFGFICAKNLKKKGLEQLWQKRNVLTTRNILNVLLSEESLTLMRRSLKRSTGVAVTTEEVVGGLRRLLNESALSEFSEMRISIGQKPKIRKPRQPRKQAADTAQTEDSSATKVDTDTTEPS